MKKHIIILPCLLSMVIYSCSYNDALEVESNIKSHVLFSVDDFIPESQTRTNCDPSNNYKITWASGDAIGIFPREGDQEPFVIPAEQVGQSKAAFDGGYWALKAGKTYNAYYPFSRENYASSDMKTKIPVTYLGQYQNGRECNVGAYDYTYSDWKESVGGAAVSFSFHHLGSFLVLKLPIPANATYTSLTLSAGNAVIPTTGTYDLTATTPAFVSKTKASSLSMQLNSFTGVAGENATFYMMVPPMDLSTETLSVTLSTGTTSCAYSIESKNISAAKLYNLTGTPVSSTVIGTVDEWLPAQDPFNGHEYVDLGLKDDQGRTIYWATCNVGAETPEDYGYYFAWGETIGYPSEQSHSFCWENYSLCNGTWDTMKKYCDNTSFGTKDGKTKLEIEDDAAHVIWEGAWRMPTYDEMEKLRTDKNLTKTWDNTRKGYIITSQLTEKSIFLPSAGYRNYSNTYSTTDSGYYWTSTLYRNANEAYGLQIGSYSPSVASEYRYFGRSIRAVCVVPH